MNKTKKFTAITVYILFLFEITAPCSPKICKKSLSVATITCPSAAGFGYLMSLGAASSTPAIQALAPSVGILGVSICCLATCCAPKVFIENEEERNALNLRHAIQPYQLNMTLTPVRIQPAQQQPEYIQATTIGNTFIDQTSNIHIK
jgi:hypothetical protein